MRFDLKKAVYGDNPLSPWRKVCEAWGGERAFFKELPVKRDTMGRWRETGVIPWWFCKEVYRIGLDLGKPLKWDHFQLPSPDDSNVEVAE